MLERPRRRAPRRVGGDGELEVFCADEQSAVAIDTARWRALAIICRDAAAEDLAAPPELTFSPGRDENSIACRASLTGFSARWTMLCGLTFLIDQTSGTFAGPKKRCAALISSAQ
jgi:hypothetical protein